MSQKITIDYSFTFPFIDQKEISDYKKQSNRCNAGFC